MRVKLLLLSVVLFIWHTASSQCGPNTPTFNINLTGKPDSVWKSPSISRNDNCCGTSAPDKCIKFIITLDPKAQGISFDIPEGVGCGAKPGGALFFQIGCGPPQAIGAPICLIGVGPHVLTFCKPGNNPNCYEIRSIPPATAGTDVTINDGCTSQLHATGYIASTVTWNSIYPGASGAYNNFLSCVSGCLDPIVKATGAYPPYIDYVVCGKSEAICNPQIICDTVRVTFNPTLGATILPAIPTICFGATSITLTANGSGGTPPYSYLWNNINSSQSINVGAGTYNVVVSDGSGCPPAYASVTVTSFSVTITANAGVDDTVCIQNPIAVLNGSVTGASGGIWSGNGAFSPTNTTLSGVTYTPTATELAAGFADIKLITTGNGTCPPDTDAVRIYYLGFTGTVSITSTPVSCFGGNNGSATVSIVGGIPPYTYAWNTVPAQTTATASNLSAGTYSVTIQNGLGCTYTSSVVITQPLPLAVSSVITNVSCFGGSNGSVSSTVSGGTPVYTYVWNPGGQTTSTLTNVSAGTYTLTVTDSKNCTTTSVYTITQPSLLSVSLAPVNVNCFGGSDGSINSSVTGGTTPYTYNWNPNSATSPNISGITSGTYSLTVTDFKGCIRTVTATITQPSTMTLTVSGTNKTCSSINNGTAIASVIGGTPTYTYAWLPGGQTTASVSNLSAGTYTINVTDNKGCKTAGLVTINSPPALSINFLNQGNVKCFGGNTGVVTANVTGGTPAYTYLWSPGGQTAPNASNLSVGTYTLNVTDNNSCQAQNLITITQPTSALSVSTSSTAVFCPGGSDGSISSSATGGTAPYTYNWQPGNNTTQNVSNISAGTYTVVVTDANGCTATQSVTVTQPPLINLVTSSSPADCNASNGQAAVVVSGGVTPYTYQWIPVGGNAATAVGLPSGTYTVLVTDANGCTASDFANISSNAGPTASIVSTTTVSCYGGTDGSATAVAINGTLPYTFTWNTSPVQTTTTATGLPSGIYVVTVTDGTGCQSLATTNLISQPSQISITVTTGPAGCFGGGGSASALATGGTPGYTYTWLPSGTTGTTISGLTANTYSIQVTDANNCVQTTTFVINQPAQLISSISSFSNVSCNGGIDGTATATVTGGTPFYTYSWTPSGGNGPTAVGLPAGIYTVNVTDNMGCTHSSSVSITQPLQALSVSGTNSQTNCFSASDGSLTVNPIGGTPAYTYLWSPSGGTNQTASGLSAGQYFVLVTDAKGCQTSSLLTVSQPTAITGSLVPTHPSCGSLNGSIAAQISGGTFPYTYLWNPGTFTTSTITGIGANTYTLLVTDSKGCTKTFSSSLNNIPGPTISIVAVTNVSCSGGSDGSAVVNINQGTMPYSINWLPYGGNLTSANSLTAGTYTLNVTDAKGCATATVIAVTQPNPITISVSSTIPVSCYGGTNGGVLVSVTGGTFPYTYLWSNGQTTPLASNLAAGTYTLTVKDQKKCSASISVNISQPSSAISSSINSIINPKCYGGFGNATAVLSGGTLPYSYSWSTTPVQTNSVATNLYAGTYTLIGTDAKGCTTTSIASVTQPTQVITTAGPNDTACLGSNVVLTATATGGVGNYYYAWNPTGLINSGTLTVTPTATTSYIVIAYDKDGCPGKPDTIQGVVYSLKPTDIQAIAYSPICPGQSAVVYVQTPPNAGPLTYIWNHGLGIGPGAYLVTPAPPAVYIVTVTNYCGVAVTDSVQILFNPPPTLLLKSDTNLACAPATINFFDSSVTGNINDPISSWYWSFGDGNYSSAPNPTHVYVQPGTYSVGLTVTTNGGCFSNNASTPLIVNAMPSPIATFTTSQTVTPMNVQTIDFLNQSSGAVSYMWDFGDGGKSTLINPQHHFPTKGFYNVTLITTNAFGCTDTFQIQTTGDGGIIFPNAFTPNPNGPNDGKYDPFNFDNHIFFPFASGIEEFHMQIFNRWGELIFETFDINIGWNGYYLQKICQQDVYVWKADGKFIDGKTFTKAGDVTLLR